MSAVPFWFDSVHVSRSLVRPVTAGRLGRPSATPNDPDAPAGGGASGPALTLSGENCRGDWFAFAAGQR
jgi:hypothetical protein